MHFQAIDGGLEQADPACRPDRIAAAEASLRRAEEERDRAGRDD